MGSTCPRGCMMKVPEEHPSRPSPSCQSPFIRTLSKSTLSLGSEPLFSDETTAGSTDLEQSQQTQTSVHVTNHQHHDDDNDDANRHQQVTFAFIAAIARSMTDRNCKNHRRDMPTATTIVPSCVSRLCCSFYFSSHPLRRKRVVFTSIFQLNACIDRVPSYILDESIFLFKVRDREQLLARTSQSLSGAGSRNLHSRLVSYIDKQRDRGLLLVLDDASGWSDISDALRQLRDLWFHDWQHVVTYKPLRLAQTDWKWRAEDASKYGANGGDVLHEIESGALKFAPSMELLWQSNPTLIPMTSFDHEQYLRCNATMGGEGGDDNHQNAPCGDDSDEFSCTVSSCDDFGDFVILSKYFAGDNRRPAAAVYDTAMEVQLHGNAHGDDDDVHMHDGSMKKLGLNRYYTYTV